MILRIVLILQVALKVVVCSEDEERLVRDLFRDYNKLIRPVEVMNETVEVEFGLSFIQLINVNEKNQIMTSNVWLQMHWMDYQLRWDEADYGGIGVLRLPPDKVWKPDVVLFNNADGNYEVRYKSNALIYASGKVEWIPPAIFQSSCTIDVTYFPFDQQKCVMKFGSWTFNGDQVALKLHNDWVDLSDYWKSGTWDIVEVPAYLNVYNGTKNGKPTETDISFYITIRRKTLFYTVNLILPTLLISFLCILVFYLPAEAGEKVTLGISILLSLVVFLLLVSKILPPTSLVLPLIAKYLLFTFVMNCISILATVIIINWNFRGPRTHKMPNWVRTVFLKYLPIVLLIRRPKKTRLRWMMDMPSMGVHYHPYDHQQQMMQQQSSPLYPLSPPAEQGMNTNNGFNMVNTGAVSSCKDAVSFNNFRSRKDSQVVLDYSCLDAPSPPVPTSLQPRQQMVQHHPSCTISQGHIHHRTEHLIHQTASSSTASPLGLARPMNGNGADARRYSLDGGGAGNGAGGGAACEGIAKMMTAEGEDDSVDTLYLTPEAYRATEAIEFIAGHLRSEDEYIQIREDWKYVAMVIDRLQLYLFFLVTTFGTLAILLDAPHIFEFVDQDKVIQMNSKGSS